MAHITAVQYEQGRLLIDETGHSLIKTPDTVPADLYLVENKQKV